MFNFYTVSGDFKKKKESPHRPPVCPYSLPISSTLSSLLSSSSLLASSTSPLTTGCRGLLPTTASPSPSLAAGLQELEVTASFAHHCPRSPTAVSPPPRAPWRQIRSQGGWRPPDLDGPMIRPPPPLSSTPRSSAAASSRSARATMSPKHHRR